MLKPLQTVGTTSGMTLIEVIVTVAIAGIIFAWGLPNLIDYVRTSRVVSATNELVAALTATRTYALTHSTSTVICASSDGTSCGAATVWGSGWLVFEDCDGDSDLDTSAVTCPDSSRPETVVRVGRYTTGTIAIQNEGGAAVLAFSATGLPNASGASLTFSVCGSTMPKSGHRTVMLNSVGQPSVDYTMTANACS